MGDVDPDFEGSGNSKIVLEYLKSPLFRATHADGVVGGLTPAGNVHVAFFNERMPIPRKITHLLNENGTLGPPTLEGREQREGVIRELDVDVVMTVEVAESLALWLMERVADSKKIKATKR